MLPHKLTPFKPRLEQICQTLNRRKLTRLFGASPVEVDAKNQYFIIRRLRQLADKKPLDKRGIEIGSQVHAILKSNFYYCG